MISGEVVRSEEWGVRWLSPQKPVASVVCAPGQGPLRWTFRGGGGVWGIRLKRGARPHTP